jgi:2-(1,2-epoxy-1,2-dihydrophenyl)acetyl-CoA isomerase
MSTTINLEAIISEQHGAVRHIVLNRPDKINSFTRQMHAQLRAALAAANDDVATRAIVLRGAGRGFCAGQDLADLSLDPNNPTDLGGLVAEEFNPLILQLQALDKPIIAQVHGIAAGAGANLALACDLTIAAENAQFLQAFVNIGLVPDSGGTWFLTHLVGRQRALGLAMLGEKINAIQAAQWGLIWQAVAPDQLDNRVAEMAQKLASLPPRALAAIKQTVGVAAQNSLAQQLSLEASLQAKLGRSPDYFEGVNAFLQKRPAVFTGA